MAEIWLKKTAEGTLVPVREEDVEAVKKFTIGAFMRCEIKQIRNYKFLQKTHVLLKTAYDFFVEHNLTPMQYKGREVLPQYDRFRKDLIILAGHYDPVYGIRGGEDVRLEAHSLSYAKCTEAKAEEIYQSVLQAALNNVYKAQISEEEIQNMVDRIIRFM